MRVLILLLFIFTKVFSQNVVWEKLFMSDSLGKLCTNVKVYKNYLYPYIVENYFGNGALGWNIFNFQLTQSKFYKILIQNGQIVDSSNAFHEGAFSDLIISDDTIWCNHYYNGLITFKKLVNYNETHSFSPSSEMAMGNFYKTDSSLEYMTYSRYTYDLFLYRLDTDLNLLDTVRILANDIAAVPTYYLNFFMAGGYTKLHYNPISKKYFLSNHETQFIFDSTLKPIELAHQFTYKTYNRYDVKLNSNYDVSSTGTNVTIELPSGSVITACQYAKMYVAGTFSYKTLYDLRLTKWDYDYRIVDSLEFYYGTNDSSRLSYIFLPFNALSWKGNPNEIYVTYFLDSMVSWQNNSNFQKSCVIVAKVDSSLNLHWKKAFIHPDYRFATWGIEALEDGGAIVYGGISENPTDPRTPIFTAGYIIRIDSSGSISSTSDPLMQIHKDYVMYPNPAKDYVWFQAQKPNQPISMRIYDIHGKLMYQKEKFQEEQINISEWSKGMYFYQIDCEGRVSNGKILKE